MPLDDKKKRLFSDLGRPTRRGIRKCPKCGTVNGTRGNSCKNKSCDVVFRDNGSKKKPTTDACRIVFNNSTAEVYSVRLRERGPDYRSFVQLTPCQPASSSSTVTDIDTVISFGSYPKCFVSACNRNRIFPCGHIKAAQKCFTTSQRILIKNSVLGSLNIPQECKQVLSIFVNELPDLLVQRCSKASFVVKCNTSSRHPLGYLHILFFKPNKEDGTSEPKFLCTCRPFKIPTKDSEIKAAEQLFDTSNKLCMHYYACVTAFASNEELSLEFEYFLTQIIASEFPSAGMLGQLHLVTLPVASTDPDDDAMVGNHISAEIMRDNLSLLETMAGDDSTLPHVQGLEGLSDQIIVASVDDTLTFGDSSALEGLGETDSQVGGHLTHISEILSTNQNQPVICQIFTSQQNLQLTNSFTSISDDVINSQECIPVETSSEKQPEPTLVGNCSLVSIQNTDDSINTNSESQSLQLSKSANTEFVLSESSISVQKSTPSSSLSKQAKPTYSHSTTQWPHKNLFTPEEITGDFSVIENKLLRATFDRWLASVNERINSTMNYTLPGKPESLVYYICHEHFDILKERIISGLRKKRLPNQTLIIKNRCDRAPVGRKLTKHVWKITNIMHVLHIFQSSVVPLKINQFFVKNSAGEYDEWNPPKEEDGYKNQPIIPVLHSTSLKIGKSDANAKENVPFSIEWTPDILPETKYGELKLCFQFSHNGPIHTDQEMRNSVAPLQKLLQGQSFVAR